MFYRYSQKLSQEIANSIWVVLTKVPNHHIMYRYPANHLGIARLTNSCMCNFVLFKLLHFGCWCCCLDDLRVWKSERKRKAFAREQPTCGWLDRWCWYYEETQCMGDHPGEWEANVQSHSHFSPEPRSNFVTRQVYSTIITVGIYP